jgi:hypothetical protein
MADSGTEDKRIEAILCDLESWRELIRQGLKPNARRDLERLIREAKEQTSRALRGFKSPN